MLKEILKKKWTQIALSAILVLFCAAGSISLNENNFEVNAATVQHSGTCGTCSWQLDDEGLLRIYPKNGTSGKLADNWTNDGLGYSASQDFYPWWDYGDSVKKVLVEGTVVGNTHIANLFDGMGNCTEMDLSGLDTRNTDYMAGMFKYCDSLTKITFGENFRFKDTSETDSAILPGSYSKRSSWVKFFKPDGTRTYDKTEYTDRQLISLSISNTTTPSMQGTWLKAGSCWWDVNEAHTLTISPVGQQGTLEPTAYDDELGYYMPWKDYLDEILKVVVEQGVIANKDSSHLFTNLSECAEMDLSGLDTSNTTDMSYMFQGCNMLQKLTFSENFGSNATDMSYMFSNCTELTSLDLSSFDTSNVKDMSYMFQFCSGLTSLDVSKLNTSNVTTMNSMFKACSSLTSLDLNNFDTSNTKNMSQMFLDCNSLTSLDLSHLSTSNVTSMQNMFGNCSSLKNLNLSNFDTTKVTNMWYMFSGCKALESLDLSSFTCSARPAMGQMFSQTNNLKKLRLSESFIFDEGTLFPNKSGWVKTRNADNSKTYNNTEYTSEQLTSFTEDTTPSIGGLWQILSTHSYITNPDGSVEYISVDSDWEYLSNNVWEYTFNVFDISKLYYLYEEFIEGYFSIAMEPYAITVRDKMATVTNSTRVDPDVVERSKLVISKVVEGDVPADHTDDEFEFIITLSGENIKTDSAQTISGVIFQNGVGKVYLKNGESVMIDLPEGTTYSVAETDKANYVETISNNEGTIVANVTATVTATNTYIEVPEPVTNAVNVTVKKAAINSTDPSAKFTISAYFAGLAPFKEYELSDGNKFTASDKGTAFYDVQISENEEITFMNIPEGATYQFTEVAGNYTSSYSIVDNNNKGSIVTANKENTSENTALSTDIEVADADEDVIVTFINEFETSQSLVIEKFVVQENEDGSRTEVADNMTEFEITVNFSNMTEGESFSSDIGKIVADDSGEASKTFYLTNGGSVKFYGIPVGVQYQVIESGNNFMASYTVTGTDVVKSSDENSTPKKALSTEVETIEANENGKVTFVNIKTETQLVTIRKVDDKGNLLEGAKLQIKDAEGTVLEEWTTTKEEFVTNLKEGTYTLHEVSAPEGYNLANDMTITITSDGDNTFTMVDVKSSWLVSTGGDGIIKVIIIAIVLGGAAGVCIYVGKKKSNCDAKSSNKNNK